MREILESYGSNYEETMERFLEDETFYLKILGMLLKDASMKKLHDALDSKDVAAAFDAAHTLKGISGNLGLTPFYAAVCTMVEALRGRDPEGDYFALYQCVEAEYKRVELLWQELHEI
ncbi:Hpt domain-containing protein [Allofournierella sp.]|uniref:Hpt domain-containing protein n=1 Tax=Allofournierella sp. TaxID=1940256 RepID=UPI003AB54871